MKAWIFSTEPGVYPWSKVEGAKGPSRWDGIRGPAARKFMRGIAAGDLILGYHSSPEKALVCVARAATAAYPDPADALWLALDVTFERWLKRPVALAEMRAAKGFADNPFLRIPRLSVAPVTAAELKILLKLESRQEHVIASEAKQSRF